MRMKLFTMAAALLVTAGASTTAEARRYEGASSSEYSQSASRSHRATHRSARSGRKYRHRQHSRRSYRGHRVASHRSHRSVGGRPARWCGWYMRTRRGGGPEFNVAWNWRKYGRSSGPQVGAVVVWRHHVGEITGRTASGQWIVRSGNDGGRVRERPRSVAGAVFRVG
jgi:hypothetical protein